MLKIQEIREIIKLIDHSSIEEFVYEAEGTKVKLKKNNGQVSTVTETPVAQPSSSSLANPIQEVASTPAQKTDVQESFASEEVNKPSILDASLHKITSPMVGTYYKSSSPDSPAYVQVGDKVNADAVVCIVEAMKLFNEIEAEVSGEIVEILVEDGQLVEYGQPLFLVKAN
jgi:acetyl-CoA carboxylase biotin carboxyl carrier protein